MTGIVYEWNRDFTVAAVTWRGILIGTLHRLLRGAALLTNRGYRYERTETELRARLSAAVARREAA